MNYAINPPQCYVSTNKRGFKPRRCHECGEGTIRPLSKEGRRMPFRDMPACLVPSTVAIPTCDHCGNEYIDQETADALDEAFSAAVSVALPVVICDPFGTAEQFSEAIEEAIRIHPQPIHTDSDTAIAVIGETLVYAARMLLPGAALVLIAEDDPIGNYKQLADELCELPDSQFAGLQQAVVHAASLRAEFEGQTMSFDQLREQCQDDETEGGSS